MRHPCPLSLLMLALCSMGATSPLAAQSRALPLPDPSPPTPRYELVNGQLPVPANGALLVRGTYPGTAPWISVTGEDGTPVAGGLRDITDSYVAWVPSTALQVGARYVVNLQNEPPAWITITAPFTASRPPLTAAHVLSALPVVPQQQCCTELSGQPAPMCFATRRGTHARLQTTISSSWPAEHLHQYVYQLAQVLADGTEAPASIVPWQSWSGAFSYAMQRSEYCVRLRAIEIATGVMHEYPDLVASCVPHGDLEEVSVSDVDVVAEGSLSHERCQIPPSTFARSFCEVNASACSADRALRGCEAYGYVCLGEARPMAQTAGTGGASGEAGGHAGSGSAASGGGGSGGATGAASDHDGQGGPASCTVTQVRGQRVRWTWRSASLSVWWLAGVAFACGARRARRRTRPR